MKSSLFYDLKEVSMEEIEEDPLESGDVRIKVDLCGVCGSDIKTYVRGAPYITPPAVLGHEVVGTVIDTKNKKWKKNDRVAVVHYLPCGSCDFCLAGKETLCPYLFDRKISPGGFSEFLRIPKDLADRGTFKIPDNINFEQAVLSEPLACCIHGAKKANISTGSYVVTSGDGPMGLLHAQNSRLFGASNIILSGMSQERLNVAEKFADNVINANESNVAEEVKKNTEGLGPDVVIVAVASVKAANQAIDIDQKGGTVLLFGGFSSNSELTIDPNRIHYDEINVIGSLGSTPSEFYLAFKFLIDEKIDFHTML